MATKSNTEMSDWIKFFTAAGIPPGPAAKYAMTFMDNRIQKSMLMDLTKEYLKEMGVSVMGDVICILKYAKSAYSQYERDRPILEAMPQPQDGKIELKRQTTPGNRMLEHYMRREGILEENPKVKVSTAMATRLGAVPTTGSKKNAMGIPGSVEVIPVKKARRVPPEEEGSYIISLPKGSTERTKKILGQKAKVGVFARLGAGSSGAAAVGTTSSAGIIAAKATTASTGKKAGSPNVFNRLGGQNTIPSPPSSPVLQYHGVLKSPPQPSPTPKVTITAAAKAKKISAVQERLGVQRPEVSTTTTSHMDTVGLKHSLQARLGGQKNETSPGASQKMTITFGNDGAPTGSKKSAGIMSRLGAQKDDPPSPKLKQMISLKPGVAKRLGDKRNSPKVTAKTKATSSGVMARLGQKQGTTATVTLPATPAGRLQKRLGLPVKSATTPKSSMKERLGLQKAEASSTTPSFTVTLGTTPTSQKSPGSSRKRKRKAGGAQVQTSLRSVAMGQDVFSRLGSG
ncbi:uncharacterized protein C19orf47-like [Asterias rubens]|uniref:uncharacterized protein C19orf47-like n=1 Tax=Asterias rubens TaxID=7604 RepID=UPI0014555EBC|nr:uncharacterized protein C19orf47-like [Asterias rubens]